MIEDVTEHQRAESNTAPLATTNPAIRQTQRRSSSAVHMPHLPHTSEAPPQLPPVHPATAVYRSPSTGKWATTSFDQTNMPFVANTQNPHVVPSGEGRSFVVVPNGPPIFLPPPGHIGQPTTPLASLSNQTLERSEDLLARNAHLGDRNQPYNQTTSHVWDPSAGVRGQQPPYAIQNRASVRPPR